MAEIDMEKAQRLNEVYKYVFAHFDIRSQKDFADFLHVQRTGLSAAMNGSKANLTKNLFTKICAAFPGVFNLDYLLTGNGELLLEHQEPEHHTSEPIDHSSLVNAMLASRDETIASKEETIASKNETIASQKRTIAALEQQISTDQQLITSLRQQIDYLKTHTQITDYPFNIGVADNSTPNPDQV